MKKHLQLKRSRNLALKKRKCNFYCHHQIATINLLFCTAYTFCNSYHHFRSLQLTANSKIDWAFAE